MSFFDAEASAAPASIACLAASDKKDLFWPVDGDADGGEDLGAPAVTVVVVELEAAILVEVGEVEGSLVKYEEIDFAEA